MGIERIITQFKRVIDNTQSAEALMAATADITRWLGFRHYALSHHVDPAVTGDAICLTNYPPRWVEYYQRRAFGLIDPVHRASHMTQEGFWWPAMPRLIQITERDDRFMRLGRIHGIGTGFTVPNNVLGALSGSCTFATEPGFILDPVREALAQIAGLAAFGAALRLWPGRWLAPAHLRPVLTPHQLACVELVAKGLNDRQIGQVLGIAEETVASHIKNACERYGVRKRTMLVILALMDGAIMLSNFWR